MTNNVDPAAEAKASNPLAEELTAAIPEGLRGLSGTALYTGRAAWTGSRPVYVLGDNPGGEPGPDTVAGNLAELLFDRPADYSEYRDGQWMVGRHLHPRGQAPMQRRVLHLFDVLGLDPGAVPVSNIVYVRSPQASHLDPDEANRWAEECWPLHAKMIERLGVKVVVCFGARPAGFVRSKVGAHTLADTFRETYANRSWASCTYTGPGPSVVQLTHPGRADWTNPNADPTGLVVRALGNCSS
ncbi:hypothetical protein F0U44_12105 [Nocardioides humilatus]|uniref:Uracil-DNA glycosylase-like domain-containing protein n=1 Tax=Nocardioides humilatus TaxID=2607660 RepID=A0A5B1LG86_9ACTN|nr:hypothetical protein [Nocardioides humilatus]KAA1419188.1 hypothetical protein F0U44_12105 [Nocardioides humilatus]